MYFYGNKGQQHLDLRNDLILTFDRQLVTAQSKKVAPDSVKNANYILMQETSRIKATMKILWFIWSRNLIKLRVKTMSDGKETGCYQPEKSDLGDKDPPKEI